MKAELRYAILSSAVVAAMYGPASVQAADLIWDPTGAAPTTGSDGSGNWDNLSLTWANTAIPANVAFSSATPDSAIFGTNNAATGTGVANQILLNDNITVQNLTLGTSATGAGYNLFDQGDGLQTLTINGNIIKAGIRANPQILLTNAAVLSAGNHIIAAGDSPGDLIPELTFNSALTGAGSITIDNTLNFAGGAADVQYGTTAFNVNNSYTGGTNVISGRLVANTSGALGTGQVTISGAGALSFGGGGTTTGDLNISNNIQITRSDYATANTNNRYTQALIAANDGSANTITINSPVFDVASTDARVGAYTNTVVINSNITSSTGTGVLTVDGDFSGFVTLNGNNTGLATGGVKIQGGVELNVNNNSNLGGANSPLTFAGGTLHPVGGFMTDFGTHVLNNSTFNGGIDTEAGTTFTINQALGRALGDDTNRVGSIGKRGTGTLNLNSNINLRGGQTFWDGGIVNVNAPVELANLHLRSPVVNIGTGGSITTVAGFNSFGQDSTGTNGSPDQATINITGTGKLIQTSGDDFNVSDNVNTKGTINLGDNGVLTTGGITALGKQTGAVGTINQTGGTFTVNRSGNFAFIVGRDNGKGVYNLSGGTFNTNGEAYVGQGFGDGVTGNGTWTQTGGTATINNWFVVGREGGKGTVDISGGTLIKKGGGNTPIGEGGNNTRTNSFTIRGTGTFDAQTGEVWVSNGNTTTTMTIADTATFNVNNWLAVGRGGGHTGIINMSGGTINKAGAANQAFSVGSGGTGTVNQTGGTINNLGTEMYFGEGGVGTYNFSGGTLNVGLLDLGHTGGGSGTANVSGSATINAGLIRVGEANSVAGTLNFDGGNITADQLLGRNSTGAKTVNFNGGTLHAKSDQTNFISGLNTANVRTGGVKIDSNTHAVTVAQTLIHEAALGATVDGGLTKTGLGTLTLTGSNTYTGATTVNVGTLQASSAAYATVLNPANGGLNVQKGKFVFDYTATTSPVSQIKTILDAGYAGGFASGQIRSVGHDAGLTLGYGDDGLSKVTIMSTLSGDADLNGTVDFNDFLILQNNFAVAGTRFDQGNFNYDGQTDFNDFLALQNNFGQSVTGEPVVITRAQVAAMTAFANSDASLVPEPGSLAVIAGVASALGGRRRRRTVSAS